MNLGKIMLPVLTTELLIAGSAESIYKSKCASCHGKNGKRKPQDIQMLLRACCR